MSKAKIILYHPSSRKTFDIYNYLIAKALFVDILMISHESLVWKSLYPKAEFFGKSPLNYSDNLYAINEKYENSIFLPIEEDVMEIYFKIRTNLRNIKSVLPDEKVFHLLRDKYSFVNWCMQNDISVPKLRAPKLMYNHPVILKPRKGSGSRGIRVIHPGESALYDETTFMLQDFVKSHSGVFGFFGLVRSGEIVSWHTHIRLRTWPSEGGVSILAKSDMELKLYDASRRIIKLANYEGLIMIEYMYDSDSKEFKVIEVNPRIWGSFMLSEFSGVPLLQNYLNICHKYPLISSSFTSKCIRWLLPYEVVNLLKLDSGALSSFRVNNNTFYIGISNTSLLRAGKFIIYSSLKKLLS